MIFSLFWKEIRKFSFIWQFSNFLHWNFCEEFYWADIRRKKMRMWWKMFGLMNLALIYWDLWDRDVQRTISSHPQNPLKLYPVWKCELESVYMEFSSVFSNLSFIMRFMSKSFIMKSSFAIVKNCSFLSLRDPEPNTVFFIMCTHKLPRFLEFTSVNPETKIKTRARLFQFYAVTAHRDCQLKVQQGLALTFEVLLKIKIFLLSI